MELPIKILIYIHAFLGGLGLVSGLVGIVVKKGEPIHKKSGKTFSYSIAISALISVFIARMPNHENLFLFLIGIFTIYLVLAGNRALTLKDQAKMKADWIDIAISSTMLMASLFMIAIAVVNQFQHKGDNVLYALFGGLGMFLSVRDFQTFSTFQKQKNKWLKNHLGRMIGALIASITAFLVAGLHIHTTIVWILPTILGILYIIFWNNKLKKSVDMKSLVE